MQKASQNKTGTKDMMRVSHVETPNDPKLSDGGARRAGCGDVAGAGWAKVAGRWAAASVTRGAVRCSAWLGVAGFEDRVPSVIEFCGVVGLNRFDKLAL